MSDKTVTTNGWEYFNWSTGEWEWCGVRPSEDDAKSIRECTKERFYKRFPDHG